MSCTCCEKRRWNLGRDLTSINFTRALITRRPPLRAGRISARHAMNVGWFSTHFEHANDNDRASKDEKVVQTRGCNASRPARYRPNSPRNIATTCRKSQNSGMWPDPLAEETSSSAPRARIFKFSDRSYALQGTWKKALSPRENSFAQRETPIQQRDKRSSKGGRAYFPIQSSSAKRHVQENSAVRCSS